MRFAYRHFEQRTVLAHLLADQLGVPEQHEDEVVSGGEDLVDRRS
jgi:hypothetical protein